MAIPNRWMDRPLDGMRLHDGASCLISEQVDGVRRVVPQQMVRPAARLSEGIRVRAPEEVRLHIEVLDVELAGQDSLSHPLMAGIEAAGVTTHGDLAKRPGRCDHRPALLEIVAQRNLHLDVFAGLEAGPRLSCVHRRGCAEDDRVEAFDLQTRVQVGGHLWNLVLPGDLFGLGALATDQCDHLHAVDDLDCVEVFDTESAGTGQGDVDAHEGESSRMRCPTAVLLAGT